uniref:Uncharacterized protein n=1 Tax=Schizaphis graminum TaxID=13262 RepID=A0A2S2PEI8_SCHGA
MECVIWYCDLLWYWPMCLIVPLLCYRPTIKRLMSLVWTSIEPNTLWWLFRKIILHIFSFFFFVFYIFFFFFFIELKLRRLRPLAVVGVMNCGRGKGWLDRLCYGWYGRLGTRVCVARFLRTTYPGGHPSKY